MIYRLYLGQMVLTYKHKPKAYNNETLRLALKEISEGAGIRATAKKYNIGYGKL